MFGDVHAFSGFSVNDIEAARAFYGGTLGLTVQDEGYGMVRLAIAGGNPILVYPKTDHAPATYTILNFPVDDLAATLDALAALGVETIKYPGTDGRGISWDMGPAIAWITDPAGNIIAVIEEPTDA